MAQKNESLTAKEYVCNWDIVHNDKKFSPGQKLLLEEKEAAPLVAVGAVSEVQKKSEKD
jgi:hypothetical protein